MTQNQARHWQESYVQQPERQQKVVVKVKRRSWLTKGEKIIYSLCAIMMIIDTFYIVSFSSNIDSIHRESKNIEAEIQQKIITNNNLTFEVKELSEPGRILENAYENGLKIQDAKVKRISKATDN